MGRAWRIAALLAPVATPAVAAPDKPFRPPESRADGPGLAAATRMAVAAVQACRRSGHRVGVAVVDSAADARLPIGAADKASATAGLRAGLRR